MGPEIETFLGPEMAKINWKIAKVPSPSSIPLCVKNGSAELPCSMEGGRVYTVLWYRAGEGEPFYT